MQGTHIHTLEIPPPLRSSIFYTCFLSSFSPPPPPPPEERGSQAKVSHLIRSLQWCQPLHTGKNNQSRPLGRFPCESKHLLGTRPTGHPAHAHAQTEVLGTRVESRVSLLTPASNTAHFFTALRHFGFPRTAGAFWVRGATLVPNGSSPGQRVGGDCAASAEEHRALRPWPKLNKEGLFHVAVGVKSFRRRR